MILLTLKNLGLAYGHQHLLRDVSFQIERGERVCLVGRNGAGKSTLFRVISGQIQVDDGEIWYPDTLRISYLEQDVPLDSADTIFDVVAAGLGEVGELLSRYHHALHAINHDDPHGLSGLAELQHAIEVADGWNIQQRVEMTLSRLDLQADKRLCDCSGGMRRRVLLARSLISQPDLLLLDEPTNHMDIAAIGWLEEYLLSYPGALIFITHDRTFLKNLATRIIELDRGTLTSFPGDYENYLRRKEEMLEAEARANAKFDKRLSEEEAWIRQGVKARRTRNEGRVRALLRLREQRRQRVETPGKATLQVDSGDIAGKLVADLRDVSFAYGEHTVIDHLSTRILRGDRVGIIGPNGSGKSTLLKLILGEIKPSSGRVVLGTKLDMAYFDQHRSQLDPEKSVRNNLSEGSDYITVKGRSRHVIGYLRSFLFPPERVDEPVKNLSGGERNRLLLAKLFTQPANMLVLDEPTNDLDVDTLELLEELLNEYEGTLLLVSHDRTFLDNVVTSTLVFEGHGQVGDYVGGYEDWLRQRKPVEPPAVARPKDEATPDPISKSSKPKTTGKVKLSFNEQRELQHLPERIEALEEEQREIELLVSQGDFYQGDKVLIKDTLARLETIQQELGDAYRRWEYLDGFAG
ncbi:MAG: ATP-binding cassette domain-containing protein [Gammaproteobacteria bacterium]|nr:ATP-binding cassette domain-containing protein [Gammaproteobacteria bacterium]